MDSICLKYDVVFGARKPCPRRAGARFFGGLAVFLEKNIYITLKFHDIIEYEFHIVQNEKDPKKKRKILKENLEEHQRDAHDVRDFIYNAFQESKHQLGKRLSYLYSCDNEFLPLE